MHETVRKAAMFALLLIMAGVLAPLAGLAAGVAVLALLDVPGTPAAIVVAVATATALGCWAGLVLEPRTPDTRPKNSG